MKNTLILIGLLSCFVATHAQESNNEKQLWAKSILNQKAPELVVEEWITQKPETKGKFILIDFWATWCGPCLKAIPELNEIQKKFAKDLVVIGISAQTAEKVKEMKDPIIEYANGVDTQKTMEEQLEIKGIPHVILIDPKGIVRWEGYPMLDGHKLTPEVIETLIKKYK